MSKQLDILRQLTLEGMNARPRVRRRTPVSSSKNLPCNLWVECNNPRCYKHGCGNSLLNLSKKRAEQ